LPLNKKDGVFWPEKGQGKLGRMINDTEQERPAILGGNAYEHILGLRTVLLE